MQQPSAPVRPTQRFFYGYIMIIAAFFIMLAYSASRTVYGIFFEPMISQLHWSAALLSGAFSLNVVMDGLSGIMWGQLTDRWGPRRMLIAGALLAGSGYILVALVHSVWQMYLIYGVMIGIGMGGIFVPVSTTFPRWFITRRNAANGISLAGMGVGTLMVSPVAYWMVSSYGWPTSYKALGIAFLVIVLVAGSFIRSSPAEVGQVPYNKPSSGTKTAHSASHSRVKDYSLKEAVRSRQMWLAFMMFFCFGFASLSLMVHLVPHIINIKISAASAAAVMGLIGAINIGGRLAFGFIGDKIGCLPAYRLGLVIILGSLIWLLFINQIWAFYVFGVLWGFSAGGMGSVQTPIIAELFGTKYLGAIFGVCGLGVMIGGSIGPVVIGYLYDIQGNYHTAFITCAAFAAAGIILNLVLTRLKNRLVVQNA